MFASLLLPLILGASLAPADGARAAVLEPDPPIRIWMSSDRQYEPGDKARVQVETRDDGYVLVLNRDSDGRLRVLFPLDPKEDNFVKGGHRYEIRGRGDHESFLAGGPGDGMIFAAVSADPFRLEEFNTQGNWDYTRLTLAPDTRDPERDITELVQRIATSRGFDYDIMSYGVQRPVSNNDVAYNNPRYDSPDYYDSYRDPFICNSWRVFSCPGGLSIGYGYDPYYDDGFFYGGFGYPFGYPYGYGYGGYGYGTYGYYFPGRHGYRYPYLPYGGPVLGGRPRGHEGNSSVSGTYAFGGSLGGGLRQPMGYRPRLPEGRARGDMGGRVVADGGRGTGRRVGEGTGQVIRPNVDRSRPEGRSGDNSRRPVQVMNDARPPARRANNDSRPPNVERSRPEQARPDDQAGRGRRSVDDTRGPLVVLPSNRPPRPEAPPDARPVRPRDETERPAARPVERSNSVPEARRSNPDAYRPDYRPRVADDSRREPVRSEPRQSSPPPRQAAPPPPPPPHVERSSPPPPLPRGSHQVAVVAGVVGHR